MVPCLLTHYMVDALHSGLTFYVQFRKTQGPQKNAVNQKNLMYLNFWWGFILQENNLKFWKGDNWQYLVFQLKLWKYRLITKTWLSEGYIMKMKRNTCTKLCTSSLKYCVKTLQLRTAYHTEGQNIWSFSIELEKNVLLSW